MKDQTDQDSGAIVSTVEDGTAIFLMRQPDGSKRKVMHRLNSYASFAERANDPDVVAGRWVPHRMMSYQFLQNANCAGVQCVDRCVHPGCICDPDTNTCV